jgi:hypothetical protein
MTREFQCHLCGLQSWPLPESDSDFLGVGCTVCGEYSLHRQLVGLLDDSARERLKWRVREATDRGERLAISSDNWKRLSELTVPTVPAKLTHLLEEVARLSLFAGDWVRLDWFQTLARLKCQVPGEIDYLSRALVERGVLVREHDGVDPPLQVTAKGWEALAPIGGAGVPGLCFVAMGFAPGLNEAYDVGIRPAIEIDCGLRAMRLDREEHNDQITDRILAGIRSAQVVIADVTEHRQNVYYETGFAEGLGRVVIRTCQAQSFSDVPFDTRQFSHVVWDTPEDLRAKLAARLRASVVVPVSMRLPPS